MAQRKWHPESGVNPPYTLPAQLPPHMPPPGYTRLCNQCREDRRQALYNSYGPHKAPQRERER